jgi:hypothetical protein
MLIGFKGRNETGVYEQNLLWQSGNLFVMDNHRAAAWCWAKLLSSDADHDLIHIDRHNDALQSQLGEWLAALEEGIPSNIDDYVTATYNLSSGEPSLVFRWDNYLSIYLALRGARVRQVILASHGEGDQPNHHNVTSVDPERLLVSLEGRLSQPALPAILNLDLDYFFAPNGEQPAIRILDDAYVTKLTQLIVRLDQAGHISVITIALTATNYLTAGWGPVEALAAQIGDALGRPFQLPL